MTPEELQARVDELEQQVAELEQQHDSATRLAGEIRDRFNQPVEMLGEAARLLSNVVGKLEQLLAELTT